jgi:hypothetical protein
MKTIKNQFPLRNVVENIAFMIFMVILFIVSLIQEATAQNAGLPKIEQYYPSNRLFEFGTDTVFSKSSDIGTRLEAYLFEHENFRLAINMNTDCSNIRLPWALGTRSKLNISPVRSQVPVEHIWRTESRLTPSEQSTSRIIGVVCGLGALVGAVAGTLLAVQAHGWNTTPTELNMGLQLGSLAGGVGGAAAMELTRKDEPLKRY